MKKGTRSTESMQPDTVTTGFVHVLAGSGKSWDRGLIAQLTDLTNDIQVAAAASDDRSLPLGAVRRTLERIADQINALTDRLEAFVPQPSVRLLRRHVATYAKIDKMREAMRKEEESVRAQATAMDVGE